jgi:hypothetical protein
LRDIILGVGERHDASYLALQQQVAQAAPGARLNLNVWRNGAPLRVTVNVHESRVEMTEQRRRNLGIEGVSRWCEPGMRQRAVACCPSTDHRDRRSCAMDAIAIWPCFPEHDQRTSSTGALQRASTPVATEPSTTLPSAECPCEPITIKAGRN